MSITLYDAEAPNVDGKSLSPWATKARLVLNYKGLTHKSVLLPASEIGTRLASLGMPSNALDTPPNGPPRYTIPTLHDVSTDAKVVDSMQIFKYLDEAYPDTPRVLPLPLEIGNVAALIAFEQTLFGTVAPDLIPVVGAKVLTAPTVDAGLGAFYTGAIEGRTEMKIADFLADPANVEKYWLKAKASFDTIDGYFTRAEAVLGAGNGDGSFKPQYADFVVAALLTWFVRGLGADHEKWAELRTWNGGRWGKAYDNLLPYATLYE